MKLAALFSGGKDSVMAIDWLQKRGHSVECLITIIPARDDSYMFHVPNIRWTKLQAEAMGLPIIQKDTPGEKEIELSDLKAAIADAKVRFGIEGVSAGALASNYQRDRVIAICNELGLVPFTPYWNYGDDEYMAQFVASGYRALIVGVFADGLTNSLLGRVIDAAFLDELKAIRSKTRIHLAGEGGEYETFVIGGQLFRKEIVIDESAIKDSILTIQKAHLRDSQ